MEKTALIREIKRKSSFLCIGLDTDIQKIPDHLKKMEHPVFEFNKAIIDATGDIAVACKLNTAFYESLGDKGWKSLNMTIQYLNKAYPEVFTIADAKRGDIGNTSKAYAHAFLESMNFDAVTVAPYMGEDSIRPFLALDGKWAIVLALTSNQGAVDFQYFEGKSGKKLFEKVIETSVKWGSPENLMYVVGATKSDQVATIRRMVPDHFLLIPGVGAQGGNLEEVAKQGMNNQCGLLVNSSRGIIYADNSTTFANTARARALELQTTMKKLLVEKGI